MYKGITPTITLTLPNSVDLTNADEVFVTFASKCGHTLTKEKTELTVSAYTINVFLTQEETLEFPTGVALVQVNWTYDDNGTTKRACSTIGKLTFTDNLYNGVM